MFDLLAQTPMPDDTNWGTIVTALGSLGVNALLAWYLWYRTAHADPKQREADNASRDRERGEFLATLKSERDDFRSEMRTARERGDQLATKGFTQMDKMCDSIDALSVKVDSMKQRCERGT